MNLRDFEYLIALDEFRHFGQAAQSCEVSQPTLSIQLKKLEDELGTPLIERSGRNVKLTRVGSEVVARARKVVEQVAEMRSIARHASDPRSGEIRVGCFPTLNPYLLPHAMPALKTGLPSLSVLVVEEKTQTLEEMLDAGELDAIIVGTPIVRSGIDVLPLFREDFLFAGPAHDPHMTSDKPLSVSDLEGEELLLLSEGHCLRDQALQICKTSKASEQVNYRATSLETLRHMVVSGAGYTLMPRLAVTPPVTPNPGLVLKEFEDPAPHRDVVLAWRSGSVYREVFPELAEVVRGSVADIVTLL